MKEHHLLIEKTARYYSLGDFHEKTENIWIVCHGYAQLAADFIQDFQRIAHADNYIVAPEGLSRFYTKGFFGKVGATWMTKEDRLNEIKDHVNYLQLLFEQLRAGAPEKVKFQILGFSQGCATVCRWVTMKQPGFDKLWICSGSIPEDINWRDFSHLSAQHPFHIIYGDDDPFIREADIKRLKAKLQAENVHNQMHSFEGKHVINEKLLMELAGIN